MDLGDILGGFFGGPQNDPRVAAIVADPYGALVTVEDATDDFGQPMPEGWFASMVALIATGGIVATTLFLRTGIPQARAEHDPGAEGWIDGLLPDWRERDPDSITVREVVLNLAETVPPGTDADITERLVQARQQGLRFSGNDLGHGEGMSSEEAASFLDDLDNLPEYHDDE
jgi:hypothetical protein